MDTEKIQFNIAPENGKAEIIFREVQGANELPIKPPLKIEISGTIGTVAEYLSKRMKPYSDGRFQINQKDCHIITNRNEQSITLITNETDYYNKQSIEGKLRTHPKFKEFGINERVSREPNDLGQYFKMNRFFFASREENMDLVTKLKGFEAKINASVEKKKDENGSFTDSISAIVNSNLPGSFSLKIPLFKGTPAETIEVEFFSVVNGRNVQILLVSPAAAEAMELITNKAIDAELEKIREIAPDIVIIEE